MSGKWKSPPSLEPRYASRSENCWTCPRRKLASGKPVSGTPGWSVNRLLNVNTPVGAGGCTTFRRSNRASTPVFTDDVIDYRLAFLTKGECPPSGLKPHTDILKEFPYLGTPHQKKS